MFSPISSAISRVRQSLIDTYYGFTRRERLEHHILVMLTIPRSGSTWLFDVLRCHPAFQMHPRYFVHKQLGLRGRRYPRDLSNLPNEQLATEVRPGQWENIPDPGADLRIKVGTDKRFNIEKIHPHFFDHDVDSFLKNVQRLSERHNIFLLYQVRRPEETLTSFLKYKERNPDWDHRALDEIPTHLRQVFESVAAVAERAPGIVVDYEQLRSNFGPALRAICTSLFDECHLSADNLQAIREATSREKSKSASTPFVGAKGSGEHVDDYRHYFERHTQELERCRQAYDDILSSHTVRSFSR